MKKRKPRLYQHGFSLPELIVSIVIIGVLASISLGSYISAARRQATRSASLVTAEWLDNIRKRAMQQNQKCVISISTVTNTFSPSSSNLCGQFPTLNIDELSPSGIKPRFCYFASDPLNTSVSCTSASANSTSDIEFSPRGTTTNNSLFEFYTTGGPSTSCTMLLAPLGIIRAGKISGSACSSRI